MKKVDKNFLAIKAVHAHLDDDSDGIIEIEESVEVSSWVFYSVSFTPIHTLQRFLSQHFFHWRIQDMHTWSHKIPVCFSCVFVIPERHHWF